ncbi:dnaJ homolog subfamily C member 10-like isoform X1 [Styela clava]
MILKKTLFLWTIYIIFVFSFQLGLVQCEGDYYDVLGVSKDATNKEIRKAFKKLALLHHPDKNTNDPQAHEKFLKITNIYDVLKDEELRKKYDRYGEEGLKDDFKEGGYESYNFYKDEFGIYDDDAEVTTLDRSDFESAVKSGETWFVNFYSPRCSHCHELAPTWREVARDLEDIVHIGAFECGGKNRFWCMKKRIMAFPHLVVYHNSSQPIPYRGDRSKKDLTKFIMQYVNVEVVELWSGNFDTEVGKPAHKALPWVVAFCGGGDEHDDEELDSGADCPTMKTRRKLAGMLRNLATVAVIDCGTSPQTCKKCGKTAGIHFYPKGTFPSGKDKSVVLNSLDAREIYNQIMKDLIPGLPNISSSQLKSKVGTKPVLVFFKYGNEEIDQKDTSLKKLPLILKQHKIDVSVLDCEKEKKFCKSKMYLQESTIAIFKGKGLDMFEIFHGRQGTSELSAFAQESSRTRVTTLNPEIFDEGEINESQKPWFVDFFAPWCPPCRALLPELREASMILPSINFGTIDCTKFSEVCNNYGINSYPTTMLFNGSVVTEYSGQHSSYGIKQFVEDLINPPYVHLTPKTFTSRVQQRPKGETWIVDFYANWCGPCQQLLPEWRRMAKTLNGLVMVGALDCAKPGHNDFCRRHQVESYPEIRIFPPKKRDTHSPLYEVYRGWNRQSFKLASWALKYVETDVVDLKSSDFQGGYLVDEEPWLIDFFAPWCGHCHAFAPKFTMASAKMKGKVKFGKLDCQSHPSICSKAGVNAYPSVRFYPPTNPGEKKKAKHSIESQDPDQIVREIERLLEPYEREKKKKQNRNAAKDSKKINDEL